MKKKILVVSIFAVALLTLVSLSSVVAVQEIRYISSVSFDGDTLYVGGSGANNYTTIQSAINDAVDGDTVFVYDDSSPYYENIKIINSINLIGEDRDTTVIDGRRINCVIELLVVHNSSISGFTIQNSTLEEDRNTGINITNCFELNITNNIIQNNGLGIEGLFFDYSIITNNIIRNNIEDGIKLVNAAGHIVSYNIISNNKYGINGVGTGDNKVSHNIIDNNFCGIYLLEGENWDISHNVISNNSNGILLYPYVWMSADNSIISNEFIHNRFGISLRRSFNNQVLKNNFIGNSDSAYFSFFSFFNTWNSNYWDITRDPPYIIRGTLFLFIPWFNFDWNPAQEPYDIGV